MIGHIPKHPPFAHQSKSHALLYNALLASLYWAFAEWGFLLASIHLNVSPLWPPSGLAVAALYFGGYRLVPGVLVGAFAANFFTGISPLSAAVIALGNTGEAVVAFWLLNRIRSLNDSIGRYAKPTWILAAAFLSTPVSATLGSLSIIYLNHAADTAPFWSIWLTWLCGDAIGILTLVPVFLSLRRPKLSAQWLLKLVFLSLLTGLTCFLIFFHPVGNAFIFLAFALLIPACRWFGPPGCAIACLVFALLLVSFTAIDPEMIPTPALNKEILTLDVFLIVLCITSLTIAGSYRMGQYRAPTLLFCAGWFSCGVIYYSLLSASTRVDETNFIDLVAGAESAVNERLATYADALIASAGIYLNSQELEREEWRSYVKHLDLNNRYPGINGIGFVRPFREEELSRYAAYVRAEEYPDFTIKQVPNVARPPADDMGYRHYIITHIEPLETNIKALGLDVASEQNRQDAGQRARDTGEPAMTDRIILVQDGKERPGFLIYYPMYQPGAPVQTVEQRRKAFIGWSYAPFITEVFLDGVLGNREEQIQFKIYDSPIIAPQNFVYASAPEAYEHDDTNFDHVSTLNLAGQTFSFGWYRGPEFQTQEVISAKIAAASLALGTCLLVGIVVNLQTTNRRTQQIVQAKTEDLLNANDRLQQEVHERKKAESEAETAKHEAEAANLAKSEFLATVSHEIRTPMNSVLGYSELLSGSQLTSEQHLWTNYIQSSGRSLLHIINDILDFSKIEANRLELEQIPFSLDRCVDEVSSGFSPLAGQKGLLIHYQKIDDIPDAVVGDPIRLKQILSNLISNAIKFTQHGSITASLHWHGNPTEGTAVIRVADTGIGIAPDNLSKLFDKFTQADSSTTRKFGGTGLGLAICKQLVELMGGHIRAESVVNEGTTMIVEIPFHVSRSAPHKTPPPFPMPGNAPEDNDIDVLLVDDNRMNQHLGMTLLKRLGCKVTVANDGQEALGALTAKRYPIVFLDCQMPVMDGYQATTEIRRIEREENYPTLPADDPVTIVALTADASSETRDLCLRVGMDDYMVKPFRQRDLSEMLRKYRRS